MENFTAYNPTKLQFGKDVILKLGKAVQQHGQRVLLMYGKGSIKKNGIYDSVIEQLKTINAEVLEYSGIKSNPIIDDVKAAAQLGREKDVDMILAIGGGSVIDSAKIASLCIKEELDPWQVMKYEVKPKTSVPLIAILTLAATGSEMNEFVVLQNPETGEKIGYGSPLIFPKCSFLDPQYTYSVSSDYTAYGVVDLIAHVLESYFGNGDCSMSDRLVFAIIKEAMENAKGVLENPNDYNYRSNIMLAATFALNGLTVYGKTSGDWGVHDIGHTLSYLYDTPHGASLSIVYPAWLKLQKNRIPERIEKLGKELFNTTNINSTIEELEKFFTSMNCPVRLRDINIGLEKKNEIINLMRSNSINGYNHILSEDDYSEIVELML